MNEIYNGETLDVPNNHLAIKGILVSTDNELD